MRGRSRASRHWMGCRSRSSGREMEGIAWRSVSCIHKWVYLGNLGDGVVVLRSVCDGPGVRFIRCCGCF